jgi:L-fuculose-phosphate aldolase
MMCAMGSQDAVATAREEVAAAARRLAAAGLVLGTAGNVSARAGELVAITPTGAALGELEAESITVVDRRGAVQAGALAPTSELELHLGVYARYDAGAVVHTHSPFATSVACAREELPCVHYGMLMLGGAVRVAPYRTFGTPELAAVTLDALEGKTAALMANHGAITYGATVAQALDGAFLLEWASEVYWRASALGEPRVLDAAEQQAAVEAALSRRYGSTREVEG